MFAHTISGRPDSDWETLRSHSEAVAQRAASFASRFGCAELGLAAGLLHDIGKASAAAQHYLANPPGDGRKGPDHSTAGAREAACRYPGFLGRMLAYGIAGHHSGLADFAALNRRLTDKTIEPYERWVDEIRDVPAIDALVPTQRRKPNARRGFAESFLTRMLFSSLVDGDYLETERFYRGVPRRPFRTLGELHGRLDAFMASHRKSDSALNRIRGAVLDHAVAKSALDPGLFTLTVPTGGGKTLTSLAFALEHAKRHGLERVIYVIPYTSIIEQTAAVFRRALASDEDVLEHHASFDWEAMRRPEPSDVEGLKGPDRLRQASENWDAPIVVTTAVQFFESLFANRPSRCRKLHNIANAVVILDEAQTVPLRLLRPCMAALDELAANYRTSIVLCTATQPALRQMDGFTDVRGSGAPARRKIGFGIGNERELAPDPLALAAALKRVEVSYRPGRTTNAEIVERFAGQPQMLCIVNTRRDARALFELVRDHPQAAEGVFHLTTLMCPIHRRKVLAEVRERLAAGLPVRVVSTSLLEAGVDVDFPEVWRAMAGLDSIAQAAGRCNREGRLSCGQVVVFEPDQVRHPRDLEPAIEATKAVFRAGLDPLSLEGIAAYFKELYWLRGAESMDAATLEGRVWPILDAIAEGVNSRHEFTFDFESIARAFRMIEDEQATVIVPFDVDAERLLKRIGGAPLPLAEELRRLQQFAVSIPQPNRTRWLESGVLRPVHRRLGDDLLCFEDLAHYRSDTGIDLLEPERRVESSNII
jgi:CRISPR-associated endonuclease/helicase Cas3